MRAGLARTSAAIDRSSDAIHAYTRWWRSRAPYSILPRDTRHIRKILQGPIVIADIDWFDAIAGDPSAAIAVAVRQLKFNKITATTVDLALSAVLCCALEGDRAASVVISSALRRRSRIDPSCQSLSQQWLAHSRNRSPPSLGLVSAH